MRVQKAVSFAQGLGICGISAMCLAMPAGASTVQSNVVANFATTTGSIFGENVSLPPAIRRFDLGSDTDFFQFKTSFTAQAGSANSSNTFGISSEFQNAVATGRTNVRLDITSVASSFRSQSGVDVSTVATQRWNPTRIGPFDVIAGGSNKFVLADSQGLDVTANRLTTFGGASLGFLSSADQSTVSIEAPLLSKAGIPLLKAGVSHTFTQTNRLFLEGVRGTLEATNTSTGDIVNTSILLSDRNAANFGIDLATEGTWDLKLVDLSLDHRLLTYLFDEVRYFAGMGFEAPGAAIFGGGCGDPTTDRDNGSLCVQEIPFFSSSTDLPLFGSPDLINGPGTKLNLNRIASLSLGQITVTREDPGPAVVPLPASAWMLLAGLGALGWSARRRTA